mmetsp:Transcript_21295/g.68719  ORF Transcript_21295/g.68719 Transcript_21295/m.68719 type:complete len:492 (+) Transcript_21295:253-1728(+)
MGARPPAPEPPAAEVTGLRPPPGPCAEEEAAAERRLQAEVEAAMAASVAEAAARQEREVAEEAGRLKHATARVSTEEKVEWFIRYQRKQNLGRIANAHKARADRALTHPRVRGPAGRPLIGADDPICLRLAQMATAAVDTAKNGRFVPLPRALEAPLYPHWMERRADRSYKSTSVLGEMYDRATDLLQNLFAPGRCEQVLCDAKLLYSTDWLSYSEYTEGAEEAMEEYNRELLLLMAEHGVREAEALTSRAVRYGRAASRKRNAGDTASALRFGVSRLRGMARKEFDRQVEAAVAAHEVKMHVQRLSDAAKASVRLCVASAWYYVTYNPAGSNVIDGEHGPLSFPWAAHDALLEIARRSARPAAAPPPSLPAAAGAEGSLAGSRGERVMREFNRMMRRLNALDPALAGSRLDNCERINHLCDHRGIITTHTRALAHKLRKWRNLAKGAAQSEAEVAAWEREGPTCEEAIDQVVVAVEAELSRLCADSDILW